MAGPGADVAAAIHAKSPSVDDATLTKDDADRAMLWLAKAVQVTNTGHRPGRTTQHRRKKS